MAFDQFTACVSTEEELRELLGSPGEMVHQTVQNIEEDLQASYTHRIY